MDGQARRLAFLCGHHPVAYVFMKPHGTQQDIIQSVPSGTIYNQLAILTDGRQVAEPPSTCISPVMSLLIKDIEPIAAALARTMIMS